MLYLSSVIKMSNSTGLTNNQQAVAVFLAALIAALVGWTAAGFPTDKLAIGALVSLILAGAGLAVKEYFGDAATTTAPTASPSTATLSKATCMPSLLFRMKRRLMFLQLRR
jgi:ABC-type uncharacterized transport system permease subunit